MTLQLEALRQQIEDLEIEAGAIADCLDRGLSASLRTPNPRAYMERLMQDAKALKIKLDALLAQARSTQPSAVEAWVNLHTEPLHNIANEPHVDANSAARKLVARQAIEAWQRVRSGEESYVSTNWYFLADHRQNMRLLLPSQHHGSESAAPWWKFW